MRTENKCIIERECPFKINEYVHFKGKKYKVVFITQVTGLCQQYFIDIKRKKKLPITVHENHLTKVGV